MPDTDTLNTIIRDYTTAYRKGEPIEQHQMGSVTIVEINGYPELPSQGELVDVHFIWIGFTEAAADKDAFVAALKKALAGQGEFTDMTEDELCAGPSYISVGSWLGSQDQALRLFALIKHYDMGDLIIPATFHFEGEKADEMAGAGFVMGLLKRDALG